MNRWLSFGFLVASVSLAEPPPQAYDGPERRSVDRRVQSEVRIPERRVFGRRATDLILPGTHWVLK